MTGRSLIIFDSMWSDVKFAVSYRVHNVLFIMWVHNVSILCNIMGALNFPRNTNAAYELGSKLAVFKLNLHWLLLIRKADSSEKNE